MDSLLIRQVLDKLPVPDLEHSLTTFLSPLLALLPDRRLQRVVPLAVRGILAGETPVVTAMAQSVARTEANPWPAAKRIYRLLDNPRVPPYRLTKGHHLARATVAQEQPPYLVVAVDPVNFENPYTHALQEQAPLSFELCVAADPGSLSVCRWCSRGRWYRMVQPG